MKRESKRKGERRQVGEIMNEKWRNRKERKGIRIKTKAGGGGRKRRKGKGFEVIVIEERKGSGKLRPCNAYGAIWIP